MYLIVNPVAGRGRGRAAWPQIEALLQEKGLSYTVGFTAHPGHATELARQAVAAGHQVVVAVGGDGTLTEVINGLALSPVRVGLIPVGSGNDFARSLQIPSDDLTRAVQVLAEARSFAVDLGKVGDAFFINVAGVGFDAIVARTMVEKAKWLRGSAAYVYAMLRSLLTLRPIPVQLVLDGVEYYFETILVVVANGKYFGGGMYIAPTAEVDDGYFDVVVLEDLSVPAFLRAFPSVYRGEHLTHPKIKVFRARKVVIRPGSEAGVVPSQAEGNFIGNAPKEFSIIPAACQVLAPAEVVAARRQMREELALGSLA
ncbi:MAG: diacylglycerol kinase family lipid kinase [Firmicutes bacterium]|nr:diacylglycerol kinase family lipid kinase [Bacillota bacterium]